MKGTRLTLDGRWKTFCPSVDLSFLRATLAKPLPRRYVALFGGTRGTATVGCHHVRALHVSRNSRSTPAVAETETDERGDTGWGSDAIFIDHTITAEGLVDKARGHRYHTALLSAPTKVIKEAVAALNQRRGTYIKTQTFMHHLLQHRGEERTASTYEALMASQCDKLGSASEVRLLLDEMSEDGIEITSRMYHDALWALAIHPDYLTRNHILDAMARSWINVSDEGECAVAIGLLRDGQYELAVDKVEEMVRGQIAVPVWIWDMFVFQLGKLGFVDDALKLMALRLSVVGNPTAVSLNTWYYLLDISSQNLHYAGTKILWGRFVKSELLKPPDGMVLNVLVTACRASDSDLATQAITHLSGRGLKLGHHHYEALVDCYAQAGDVKNALEALAIMAKAGIKPDRASTRSIYSCLRHSPSKATNAYEILFEGRLEKEMPIAALNVVCEALYEQDNVRKAQDLYRHVRDICPEGPNAETFGVLLSRPVPAHIAKFVASEMSAFSVKPDSAVYDNLIHSFATDGLLDDAIWYLQVMNQSLDDAKLLNHSMDEAESQHTADGGGQCSKWLHYNTVVKLIERCFKEQDSRVWMVFDQAKSRGMHDVDDLMRKLAASSTSETDEKTRAGNHAGLVGACEAGSGP